MAAEGSGGIQQDLAQGFLLFRKRLKGILSLWVIAGAEVYAVWGSEPL